MYLCFIYSICHYPIFLGQNISIVDTPIAVKNGVARTNWWRDLTRSGYMESTHLYTNSRVQEVNFTRRSGTFNNMAWSGLCVWYYLKLCILIASKFSCRLKFVVSLQGTNSSSYPRMWIRCHKYLEPCTDFRGGGGGYFCFYTFKPWTRGGGCPPPCTHFLKLV